MNRWSTDKELTEFILNEALANKEQQKHGNSGYSTWTINREEEQ